MDGSVEVILAYAREVEVITRSLAPALIYLHTPASAETMSAVTSARGEAWTAYAVELITNCPYARRRQLSGMSGVMTVLQAHAGLLEQLLRDSAIPRLELDACGSNWQQCYQQIDAFLGLVEL
jgi:hypothetical protein